MTDSKLKCPICGKQLNQYFAQKHTSFDYSGLPKSVIDALNNEDFFYFKCPYHFYFIFFKKCFYNYRTTDGKLIWRLTKGVVKEHVIYT